MTPGDSATAVRDQPRRGNSMIVMPDALEPTPEGGDSVSARQCRRRASASRSAPAAEHKAAGGHATA